MEFDKLDDEKDYDSSDGIEWLFAYLEQRFTCIFESCTEI